MEITDLEMLVLADIVYERFDKEDYYKLETKKDLNTILTSEREFQTPIWKARWKESVEKCYFILYLFNKFE